MSAALQNTPERPDPAKVLNALAQPLLTVDSEGWVIDVNIAAETFFDMGQERAGACSPHGSPAIRFAGAEFSLRCAQ